MAKIVINSGGDNKVSVNAPGKPSTVRVNEEPAFYVIKTVAPFGAGGDTKTQRVPAILTLSGNRVLLLFQQKNINNNDNGDGTGMRLAQQIITLNPKTKEITAGSITALDEPQAPEAWTAGLGFAGHAHLGRITKGENAGRIILAYNKKTTTPVYNFSIYTRYSDDEAQTWSEPVKIINGTSTNDLRVVNGGDIIEIPSGPYEGRLCFPYYHHGSSFSIKYIVYSDDQGSTWSTSNGITVPEPSSEVSLVRSNSGKLVMTIRPDEKDDEEFSGYRWMAVSTDGGATLGTAYKNTTLPSTNCQVSCINDGDQIALSGPTFPLASKRYKSRIYFSNNDGVTWRNPFRPAPSMLNYGYSGITMFNKDTYAIVFESNTNSSLGFNVNEGMKVAFFNKAYVRQSIFQPITSPVSGAQQLFDAYESRVLADGGVITDEAYTLETIQWAMDNGLHESSAVAISAQFGVKASGVNIIKLYSLFNSLGDMTIGGTSGNYTIDNTNGFAQIKIATTLRYLTSSPITLATGKSFGMGVSGTITPGTNVIRIGTDGESNAVLYATLPNQIAGVKFISSDCLASDDQMSGPQNIAINTDKSGFVWVGDIDAGIAYAILDGDEYISQSCRAIVTPLGALADFTQIQQPVLLGARKSGGAYSGSNGNWINEYWFVTDWNFIQAKALSLRLSRYKE